MSNPFVFHEMWVENDALYTRFDAPRSIDASLDHIDEEVKEVREKARAIRVNKKELAEEIGDVIMVLQGLARAAGISFHDLTAAMDAVNEKNRAKDERSHWLNPETGKITRRKPAQQTVSEIVNMAYNAAVNRAANESGET